MSPRVTAFAWVEGESRIPLEEEEETELPVLYSENPRRIEQSRRRALLVFSLSLSLSLSLSYLSIPFPLPLVLFSLCVHLGVTYVGRKGGMRISANFLLLQGDSDTQEEEEVGGTDGLHFLKHRKVPFGHF